jgi:predicted metal-dependent RNase
MRENIWWERMLKAGTIFIMICFGIALLVATYKMARADEIYTVFDSNGQIYFTNIPKAEVEVVEPIEVEVNDRYNVYDDYLSDQLREQQKDINEYWENDYRDFLRGQGVDENLMRGW